MSQSYLYRYETKGIQKWILGGRQLRDLAGGSALVEGLTDVAEAWARRAGAESVLQATAGAMTARFPDLQSLETFAGWWPLALDDWAPGLRVVQAWVPEGEGLDALHRRLAVRRNVPEVTGFEAGPWVLRTGRSGEHAVPHPIRSEGRSTLQDAGAVAKERAWELTRRKPGHTTAGLGWDRFVVDVDAWPDGPVAVVHADGIGIGRALLRVARDPEGLSRFSVALADVTSEALGKAVEVLPRRGDRFLARPIVAAGDDLTYLVPAGSARVFVREWLAAFRAASASRQDVLGGAMAAGAGIVTVHRHFPFAQAYDWAEELCTKAKSAVRELGEGCAGVIAMQRVTTALAADPAEGVLGWCLAGDSMPDALDDLVDAVRGLPRGSLRRWLTAIEDGRAEEARKLWERAREVARPEVWGRLEQSLLAVGAQPADGMVSRSGIRVVLLSPGTAATPLRDALALAHLEGGAGHDA